MDGSQGWQDGGGGMMAARIVFLDMDGVLCTRKGAGWPRSRHIHVPLYVLGRKRPPRAIDPACVALLDSLCAATGATVVVSSNWRKHRDVPGILAAHGFSGPIHADWRTDWDGPRREDEISRWLAAHGNPRHVVIDDKPVECAANGMLVLTDNWRGLQDDDARVALDWLG